MDLSPLISEFLSILLSDTGNWRWWCSKPSFYFSLMSESEAFLVETRLFLTLVMFFISLCGAFKYVFVYFSFCRVVRSGYDVFYLEPSPLLSSCSFLLSPPPPSSFPQLNHPCPDVSANFTVSCLFNDNAKEWAHELIVNLSFRDPFVCVRQILSVVRIYTERSVCFNR